MKRRLSPEDRRTRILSAALAVAQRIGWLKLTRDNVAEEAQVSVGLLYRYFCDMEDLRAYVMREAIRLGDVNVLIQGLAVSDHTALEAPSELKARAADMLR